MANFEELKKLKENFRPVYPTWILKLFSHSIYNKMYDIGIKISSQHLKMLSLVLLVIVMGISYSRNGDVPTTFVWIGIGIFVIFMLLVWTMIGLTIYNNQKIKKICKKYGITIKQWNAL